MRVTGLVCSPLCRSKAEAQGIAVPEYADQRDVSERRRWRKVGLIVGSIAAVLMGVFGFWFWYAWFGSVPKVVYSHRYVNPGYSGSIHLAANQQLVVLHGGTLEKHQLESGSVAWSVELIDRDRIARDSAAELEEMKKRREEAIREGADRDAWQLPTLDALTKANLRSAAAAYDLQVSGENVWLVTDDKLTRYGWTDGKPDQEIAVDPGFNEQVRAGDELIFTAFSPWFAGGSTETERSLRVNLATGESKATGQAAPNRTALGANRSGQKPRAGLAGGLARVGTNAPPSQGQARSKALNPAAVARQAQNLPMPNRLALPATLAAAENQRRTQAMLDEDTDAPALPRAVPRKTGARPSAEQIRRIPTPEGVVELGVRLLEEKLVTREAMKERPKKSALEGTVNAAATTDIANEIFNEMQRDRDGSTVQEDESRYQVTVRRADRAIPPWTGEVVGPPSLHSLKTVDVVVAGKGLIVLNRSNKKIWEGKLSHALPGGGLDGSDPLASADAPSAREGRLTAGVGPLVERAETLYVCDQGMLTSFGLSDGTVRWRLPSVGISGLWFDAAGLIYVNTTTGSPDSLKYSKQIDISTKTHNQVLKVDPQTGRTLWAAHNEGLVTYLWNDYIYTVESSAGPEDDEDGGLAGMPMGMAIPAHIRLKRLDARNGRVLWEHYQPRYPLDVHFDRNTIQLLFRKEVQNLRFIVL